MNLVREGARELRERGGGGGETDKHTYRQRESTRKRGRGLSRTFGKHGEREGREAGRQTDGHRDKETERVHIDVYR